LALKGQLSIDEARTRIIKNVFDIQQYQSVRIKRLLHEGSICQERQIPALAQELSTLLSGSAPQPECGA